MQPLVRSCFSLSKNQSLLVDAIPEPSSGFSAGTLREALEQNSEIELQPLYRAREPRCDYLALPLCFFLLNSTFLLLFFCALTSFLSPVPSGDVLVALPSFVPNSEQKKEQGGFEGVEICFVKSSASQKNFNPVRHVLFRRVS